MRRVLFALLLVLLGGCKTFTVYPPGSCRLDRSFWDMRERSVTVALGSVAAAAVFRDSDQQFAPVQHIDSADAEMLRLCQIYKLLLPEALQATVDTIRGEGFDVWFTSAKSRDEIPEQIEYAQPDAIVVGSDTDPQPSYEKPLRDFIASEQKRVRGEVSFVLSVRSWGVARVPAGGLRSDDYRAFFDLDGYLIDFSYGMILWSDRVRCSVSIGRDWKKDPDRPQVRDALDESFRQSLAALLESFQSWDGMEVQTALRSAPRPPSK